MKRSTIATINRFILWLIALALLTGLAAVSAYAEAPSLTPADKVYEYGNIILHKHGERIDADEWKVTVKATVGDKPVEKRKMEVVFVLDASGSMAWCTDEEAHEAGGHSHEYSCYDDLNCLLEQHRHSQQQGCYSQDECTRWNNNAHWEGWSHISGTDCLVKGGGNKRYYPLICTQEEHEHDSGCYTLSCGKVESVHSSSGETPCTYEDENGDKQTYATRIQVAKDAISELAAGLPSDVSKTYVAFSSKGYISNNADAIVMNSYANLKARGATNMMAGVNLGIDQFSKDESTKVLIIVTDGASEDGYTSNKFRNFVNAGGVVYTVGFNHSNSNLSGMAANGGSYMHAGNTDALLSSMEKIETALTAMLEDPMGTTVGFDKTSIQEVQTSGGVISNTDDTIYWHPKEDGESSINNSTIEYSYTVQLNDEADMSYGTHSGVPLNNPTNFLYGIKDNQGVANMKSAAFPIPHAEYAVSSIQTQWRVKSTGQEIQDSTEVESIICDYASATYIPAFQQDYKTITPIIPIPNSNDYYRYVDTVVTKTPKEGKAEELSGVEAVDATEPVAYVVIHQYELVKANALVVGGTKTLVGRDFTEGDRFTFTLTAVTEGAPMPENTEVIITPDSGNSAAFSFGSISYNTAGVYTYHVQEQVGSLDKMIYETTVHTLVVTVTEDDREFVVSYTMDNEPNGLLTITNRLETGSLKVEKRAVTSHLTAHQQKPFGFLISVKGSSNRPLSGNYDMLLSNGETQLVTFTNGYAAVTLRAGESAVINGLPDGAVYTVTEDAAGGFTATASGDTGVIAAGQQSVAVFDNAYQSSGLYQFIGTKTLEGAPLALNQFSFSVLDEDDNVVADGKNNADGSVFLDALSFTQEDIGTKTYTIVEDIGTAPGYLYDRTEYIVRLTITDNGDGTLSIVDDLNGEPIVFANQYISHQLAVSKTVEGNLGSRNRDFSFTLSLPSMAGRTVSVSTDGGASFEERTLDAQGQANFTLRHDQTIIFYPVSGTYTVTEIDAGSYTTTYSINQGAAVAGNAASGSIDADGGHVAFVNTFQAATPTGVRTSSASALMGICLAAGLIAITFAGRRFAYRE